LTETVPDVADAYRRARGERGAAIMAVIETGLLEDLERLRQDCVYLALKPYAEPRLPDEYLRCFDEEQRQIRPLPAQMAERARRTRPGLLIPAPRLPMSGEVPVRAWPR
jgi:hypothetical protein